MIIIDNHEVSKEDYDAFIKWQEKGNPKGSYEDFLSIKNGEIYHYENGKKVYKTLDD